MKRNQTGFTLIEIAIVLVIIGLLLGGVLKGQELINSAKVKNLAGDFKNASLFIYSYQDKFHALPGDDAQAASHVTGATIASTPATSLGNGRIDGRWDSNVNTDESYLFWQHIRLAGMAAGVTDTTDTAGYIPRNTAGGRMGITNATAADNPIAGLKGAYILCSDAILGKFAKQIDIAMDDGKTGTGNMQTIIQQAAGTINATKVDLPTDDNLHTVCMGF